MYVSKSVQDMWMTDGVSPLRVTIGIILYVTDRVSSQSLYKINSSKLNEHT